MGKEEEDYDPSNIVNTEKASRAAWLVKVPRYLSEIWEKRPGEVIGRLINQPGGETTLQSNLSDESTTASSSAQNVIVNLFYSYIFRQIQMLLKPVGWILL